VTAAGSGCGVAASETLAGWGRGDLSQGWDARCAGGGAPVWPVSAGNAASSGGRFRSETMEVLMSILALVATGSLAADDLRPRRWARGI